MTIEVIKTVNVTQQIDGTGTAFDIKDSRVTINEQNCIANAYGGLYERETNSAVGSYNYDMATGVSVNMQGLEQLILASQDVKDYIEAIEKRENIF